MENSAEFIIEKSKEYGLKTPSLLPKELFADTKYSEIPDWAKSLFIAFVPYGWAKKAEYGKAAVSGYYPASNRAYHAARELMKLLGENGIRTGDNKSVFEKEAASYCGGSFGRNTLYYHKDFGSAVFIVTFFTDAEAEDKDYKKAELSENCVNCGICGKVCPVGALYKSDMQNDCVRAMMFKKPLAKAAMKNVYQLFGCEICQINCPMNSGVSEEEAHCFGIDELLREKTEREKLGELVGKNYARKYTILQQVIAYAANTRYGGCREVVEELENDPVLAEVCEYYLDLMKDI